VIVKKKKSCIALPNLPKSNLSQLQRKSCNAQNQGRWREEMVEHWPEEKGFEGEGEGQGQREQDESNTKHMSTSLSVFFNSN
jgi:hypothetical protein